MACMHNIISWGKNTMASIYMMLLKFTTIVMHVQHTFSYKESIKARILALCLVKSSSEMASTSSNLCSSRICFMYADLSEAADFGVASVPVA